MADPPKITLESALLTAVRDAQFGRVLDFGPGNENHPVRPAGNCDRAAEDCLEHRVQIGRRT